MDKRLQTQMKQTEIILDNWSLEETQNYVRPIRSLLGLPPEGKSYNYTEHLYLKIMTDPEQKLLVDNFRTWFLDRFQLAAASIGSSIDFLLIFGIKSFNPNLLRGDVFIETNIDERNLFVDLLKHVPSIYADLPKHVRDEFFLRFEQYPMQIYISPDATITDIRDFITSNKELIETTQAIYQKNSKQVRKKTKRAVNDFIYQNRDKTTDEIDDLLRANFGIADYGAENINTIINRERKRRSG